MIYWLIWLIQELLLPREKVWQVAKYSLHLFYELSNLLNTKPNMLHCTPKKWVSWIQLLSQCSENIWQQVKG